MRCEKQLCLTMQKKLSHCLCLSQAEPPSYSPWQNKSSPTPSSPSICWSGWEKDGQTLWQCVSSSAEKVHYSISNPAIHQTGDSSGIILRWGPTSPERISRGSFSHLEHICQSVNTLSTFCLSYSLIHQHWGARDDF